MNKLFILGAYVQAPLVRETRLVSDLTMPQVGDRYEEPAYKRNPGYVQHARERARKRKPKKVCAFHRRQAS